MASHTIGIVHYRIGTDGVSLEILKRKSVLEKMGNTVKLIAGPRQTGADYVIPELEFDLPEILKIKENAFFNFKDYKTPADLMKDIYRVADEIKRHFLDIQAKENFDTLFLHNIFSHGRNIPAAKAFYDIAKELSLNVIGFNHDFYNAGSYVDIYKPQNDLIKTYLAKYVPPTDLSNIKHVTINTINRDALFDMKHVQSSVFPDTFDFDQPRWVKDNYNKTFLQDLGLKENDLIVLQATRIVERKAIELAVDVVRELTARKRELVNKTLYNGKVITEESNIVLVLAGYTEPASAKYRQELEKHIEETDISAVFASDFVSVERSMHGGHKTYSLWDTYVFADLVTFPSIWEGWGNQFIEAIFAQKPILVYEYPVFKSDVKKEGYYVVSLGDTKIIRPDGLVQIPQEKLDRAVTQTISTLADPQTQEVVENNFAIGNRFHGDAFLRTLLANLIT